MMRLLILCLILASGVHDYLARPAQAAGSALSESSLSAESAFQNGQSNVQVTGSGRVVRILADDLKGSRHQKFILKLASGQTILIAHNIDLARRIHALATGDQVGFHGEYEWNAKGGLIHWTHHDPRGQHEDGWLTHEGVIYK